MGPERAEERSTSAAEPPETNRCPGCSRNQSGFWWMAACAPWTREIYLESLTSSWHISGRLLLHGLAGSEADSTALDHDQGQPTRSLQPAVRCHALPSTPIPACPNVPMRSWSRPPSPNADSFAARSSLTDQARPNRGPVHFVRKLCRSPFVRPLFSRRRG